MKRTSVAALYDGLHAFESRFHGTRPFPVHKKLVFGDESIRDIYDWIIAEIDLPRSGRILDAGCGNGFGTTRIAERCDSIVHGISVSPAEIHAARKAAAASPAHERITFEVASYDSLSTDTYDLIVAVESLKHSTDISLTLDAISASLRAGGQLVIVDDCYSGPDDNPRADALAGHWALARLYRQQDYLNIAGAVTTRIADLGDLMRVSGPVRRAIRRIGFFAMRGFGLALNPDARSAFAGGVELEHLYDAQLMQYKAMFLHAAEGRSDA